MNNEESKALYDLGHSQIAGGLANIRTSLEYEMQKVHRALHKKQPYYTVYIFVQSSPATSIPRICCTFFVKDPYEECVDHWTQAAGLIYDTNVDSSIPLSSKNMDISYTVHRVLNSDDPYLAELRAKYTVLVAEPS